MFGEDFGGGGVSEDVGNVMITISQHERIMIQ
jgi:hypothetical protein